MIFLNENKVKKLRFKITVHNSTKSCTMNLCKESEIGESAKHITVS